MNSSGISTGQPLGLLETVTQSKHCAEDLLILHRRNLQKVSQLSSQVQRLEQENKALRDALSAQPHEASERRNLLLENSRLRLLVAEEQGEKLRWLEKYDALLGFLRKSQNDIEAARDNLQALQSAAPHHSSSPGVSDHEPTTRRQLTVAPDSLLSGSASSSTTSSQQAEVRSDDCVINGDQQHRLLSNNKVGSGCIARGAAHASPSNELHAIKRFSSLNSVNLAGGAEFAQVENAGKLSTSSTCAGPKRPQNVHNFGGNLHQPSSTWNAPLKSAQHQLSFNDQLSTPCRHSFEDNNVHQDFADTKLQGDTYAGSNAGYDDEDDGLPYYCIQPVLPSWKTTHLGHIHPPQVLLVHVSPGGREQIMDAEVYEGDVTTSDDDSCVTPASRCASRVHSSGGSAATLSQVDSEELHNCTVSLVDDLLRDLRDSISSKYDWHNCSGDASSSSLRDLASAISSSHLTHIRSTRSE